MVTLSKLKIKGQFINQMKAYTKTFTNIILTSDRLNAFP